MHEGRLTLLTSLFEVYNANELDSTSHQLAEYFIKNYDHLSDLGIYDVMDACYCSRSAVRRFCQSIGFDNFSEVRDMAFEWGVFRHYFLSADRQLGPGFDLRGELDRLFGSIDRRTAAGDLDALVRGIHDARSTTLFSADPSANELKEFQRAMTVEHCVIRLVTESVPAAQAIRTLGEKDLLVAVSTSGAFVERQRGQLEATSALRVLVTANPGAEVCSVFDQVIAIGDELGRNNPLHRMYSTYGIAYLFDQVFSRYVQAYDPELGVGAAGGDGAGAAGGDGAAAGLASGGAA
jgi:DNA-binding MurR/RpiR family transcriptional regulator